MNFMNKQDLERAAMQKLTPVVPIDQKATPLLNYSLTDLGNAERFVYLNGDRVSFCPPTKKWLFFDGKRHVVDERQQIRTLAQQVGVDLLQQAVLAKDDMARKFAMSSMDSRRVSAMLTEAAPRMVVMAEELDSDPYLLNCQNGTVDLRTGKLHEHDRSNYITKIVICDYVPGAKCPLFLTFLDRIFGGGPDAGEADLRRAEHLIKYLQRAIGYSLTGVTVEKEIGRASCRERVFVGV